MDENSPTPEDDDWSDARYDAEVEVRCLREEWMFACPDTCDAVEKALNEAIKELKRVIEAGE